MRILVVAPHPDDEAIGCGGAICLHVGRGDRVVAALLTSGERGLKDVSTREAWCIREAEAEAAAQILGIADLTFLRHSDCGLGESVEDTALTLRPLVVRERPDLIYLPHPQEWHPDHRVAEAIVRRSIEGLPMEPRLLLYEVWTPLTDYDDGQDISTVMSRKLRAVRAYRSQIEQLRYDRGVRGLNQYRGAVAWGCRYAEVFRTGSGGLKTTKP